MKSIKNFYPCIKKSFVNTNIKDFNSVYVEMRSDVKTLPTKKMRESVLDATFGDECFTEDPTVRKLCEHVAKIFGKDKGLFVPTGHMGNMISLSLFCPRGGYVLQGTRSHLTKAEANFQANCGLNKITLDEIDNAEDFNLDLIQDASPNVVAFENTHNYNGGKILNMEKFKMLKNKILTRFPNIKFHLDGSRLLNAAAALNIDPNFLANDFDSVNFCLSKGIGAPCGSLVLMNEYNYEKSLQLRKDFGGAMRQMGFLAAPALVAMEDWRERFEMDHLNTRLLADGLNTVKGLSTLYPDTNILNIYLAPKLMPKMFDLVEKLEEEYKVLVRAFDNNQYIRAVVHHQVSREQILYAIESFRKCVKDLS